MKSMVRRFGILLGALVLPLTLIPGGTALAQIDRPIKVGIIDCYSGPPATYCNELRDGFKMALEEINKQGIHGSTIEFTTRDTKFKVDIALSLAKELVMKEEVDILMGTINSAASLAVSEYCKREKVPFIVGIGMSERITGEKGHRYVFRTHANTAQMGKAGAIGLAKMPFKRYWIGGDDYEYGHAVANATWGNLKKLRPDVELLGESWWKVGEPDFTPYITAMLAAKPDAIIQATGARDEIPFLKAAKATGLVNKVALYAYAATDLGTLRPMGMEAPEGVLGTAPYHFYYPETPANLSFSKGFYDRYETYPGFGAFDGFCMARFIGAAFRKAGSLDKEKFIDALEGLTIDSPVGKMKMRAYDHQAMGPGFFGVTTKSPKYPFLIAKDIQMIPGEEIMPSIEEIRKARGE
jgi:branched-chain amino acid transport system substrate-binding protein